jgi:predicted N-acyltransferase
LNGLEGVAAANWNCLTDRSNPFIQHEYLYGLEKHDCLSGHGWIPQHIVVYAGTELVGAMPLYLRSNSHGEFVFDWAWADAYEQSGGKYYPKLVSAIPFAPVIGPRLLVRPGLPSTNEVKLLLARQLGILTGSKGLSSSHCLFTELQDQSYFLQTGFMQRLTCQFHLLNQSWRDFDDFLDSLNSKKRKQIKRERRQVLEHGIKIEVLTGRDISEAQWQAYYGFYCSTFHRRWGSPRLTLDFFRMLGQTMPTSTLLILAKHADTYVAGAFAMLGNDTVYGRHWGCSEQFPFLHFELCYYQTIEYAIRNQFHKVDAGVQGEHKLARGFQPVAACSYHWIRHPGFRQAVQDYLHRESLEMNIYLEGLRLQLPFRQQPEGGQAYDQTGPVQ